jgi:hypothetical protein
MPRTPQPLVPVRPKLTLLGVYLPAFFPHLHSPDRLSQKEGNYEDT